LNLLPCSFFTFHQPSSFRACFFATCSQEVEIQITKDHRAGPAIYKGGCSQPASCYTIILFENHAMVSQIYIRKDNSKTQARHQGMHS